MGRPLFMVVIAGAALTGTACEAGHEVAATSGEPSTYVGSETVGAVTGTAGGASPVAMDSGGSSGDTLAHAGASTTTHEVADAGGAPLTGSSMRKPESSSMAGASVVSNNPILFDAPLVDAGEEELCSSFSFSIETLQSCALGLNPETADEGSLPVDAEAFIEIQDTPFRILAMDRWGAGHIVAWCDGTTVDELAKQFPLLEYLGQKANPRVASFGHELFCGERVDRADGMDLGFEPGQVDYLGLALPIEYVDDPAALREDYDALIVCAYFVTWTEDYSQTIQRFVSELGGGALLVGEFTMSPDEVLHQQLTSYALGSGIEFRSLNLVPTLASADVDLHCVADVPPLIR